MNRPPGYAAQFRILFSKEIAVEFRSRETAVPMAVFAAAALIAFQFSFDLRGGTLNLVAPGVLWVAIIFASLLGLGRSFAREVERGSLDGLLASPIDPGALYLAKVAANVLMLIVLEIVIVPLTAVLFNLQLFQPALLLTLFNGEHRYRGGWNDPRFHCGACTGKRGATAHHAAAAACARHHRRGTGDGASD